MNTKGQSNLLTDEQLEAVAGGDECIALSLKYADPGYVRDGGKVTFAFSLHQRVYYRLRDNCLAEIVGRGRDFSFKKCITKKNGNFVETQKIDLMWPVYDIRIINTREVITGVMQFYLAPYTFCSM